MSWTELRCTCEESLAEALGDALMAHGALSVSVEDADAGSAAERPLFGEPGSAPAHAWRRNRLVALFEAGADIAEAFAAASREAGAPALNFETGVLQEQDWVRMTQSQFDPIRIAANLWIVPTWHAAPDPSALSIRLDPGLAFGTGSHPTTRLCLRWLAQAELSGRTLLDYGCGSGILAIAARKLGAARVWATDIDAQALRAAHENAVANACQIDVVETGAVSGLVTDIVVANILTNPLKVLAPALAGHVATGGRLILSGILDSQEDEVIAAYAPLARLCPFAREEGWTCLTTTMER